MTSSSTNSNETSCPVKGKHRRCCRTELVYPIVGVLANAIVIVMSMRKVGKLRSLYSIRPPSCDPPPDCTEDNKQKWYCAWRAQQNCIEWFSLTTPIFVAGAFLAQKAFGKWATRAIGVCSIANAVFRYGVKYHVCNELCETQMHIYFVYDDECVFLFIDIFLKVLERILQ